MRCWQNASNCLDCVQHQISMVANSLLVPKNWRAEKCIALPTCLLLSLWTWTTEETCLVTDESTFWALHTWNFPCTFFSVEKKWMQQSVWSKAKVFPPCAFKSLTCWDSGKLIVQVRWFCLFRMCIVLIHSIYINGRKVPRNAHNYTESNQIPEIWE